MVLSDFRLTLIVIATAVVSVAVSSALAILVTDGPHALLGSALGIVPVPPAVVLIAALAACGWLVRRTARKVLHSAQELDDVRRQYGTTNPVDQTDTLVDTLTGLGNHRAFQEEFDRQLDAVRRYGHLISLVLIDLDDFKLINDSAGHAVGDKALAEISKLLRSALRRSDRAFRVGGDEFAVLMPGTVAEEGLTVTRRILSNCLEPRRDAGFERGFSFSAGIASAPSMGIDAGRPVRPRGRRPLPGEARGTHGDPRLRPDPR